MPVPGQLNSVTPTELEKTITNLCKDPAVAYPKGSKEAMFSSASPEDCREEILCCMTSHSSQLETEKVHVGTKAPEDSFRLQRLKRRWTEMARPVQIPEMWGQETLLKDWMDNSAIRRSLVPVGLVSSRNALVEEHQHTSPTSSVPPTYLGFCSYAVQGTCRFSLF